VLVLGRHGGADQERCDRRGGTWLGGNAGRLPKRALRAEEDYQLARAIAGHLPSLLGSNIGAEQDRLPLTSIL